MTTEERVRQVQEVMDRLAREIENLRPAFETIGREMAETVRILERAYGPKRG